MAMADVNNDLVHDVTYLSPPTSPPLSWIQNQGIGVWIRTTLLRAPTPLSNPIIVITILALASHLLYLLAQSIYHHLTVERNPPPPFPFMRLPPELRDMVYEYLLDDPYYPPQPPCTSQHSSFLGRLRSVIQRPSRTPSTTKNSNRLFLTCKQVYKEYMDILGKKKTFHFTASSQNSTPSTTSTSTPPPPIFTISPHTLPLIHTATLTLTTTPTHLGITHPLKSTPSPLPLPSHIATTLELFLPRTNLHITIRAIGDPLWSPLWVWYHLSQSIKARGDGCVRGIRFDLDGNEMHSVNHVVRQKGGEWEWRCEAGHCVGEDERGVMSVRTFCNALFLPCGICTPEVEGE